MPVSLLLRRGTTLVVLAGYLLAATASGMFHRHGECSHGTACGADRAREKCPGEACPTAARATHGCSHGHHHHHHDDASTETPEQPVQPGIPGRHGPLRHDDCAACQFLAQESLAAPTLNFAPTSAAAPHVAPPVVESVPAIVADAHPARGPPCRG